jgi:hypothetical protein
MKRNKSVDLDALMQRIQAEGAKCLLTRAEAAALVANRTMDKNDSPRGAKNRIAMKLKRAEAKGTDFVTGGIETSADGRYTVHEIRRWAARIFGELFNDLPVEGRVFSVKINDGIRMSSGTDHERLPGSLDESHRDILDLRAQLGRALENFRNMESARRQDLYARFGKK